MYATADYVVSSRKPVIARACGDGRGLLEAKTVGVDMELEDKENGDVIEGEDQLGWSFFSGVKLV